MPPGATLQRSGLSIEQLRRARKNCPAAGEHGTGVFCRIERSFLDYATHPVSVVQFCAGNYRQCPTWIAERENEWAQRGRMRKLPLVSEADERAAQV